MYSKNESSFEMPFSDAFPLTPSPSPPDTRQVELASYPGERGARVWIFRIDSVATKTVRSKSLSLAGQTA